MSGTISQVTTYRYDANGDLDQVSDALSNTTHYAHDRHRRVSRITDAAGGSTWIDYSPLGQVVQLRDARNNATSYSYDGLGNLLSQSSPDTGTSTFTYNAVGQLLQSRKADLVVTSYSYDSLGRLTSFQVIMVSGTISHQRSTYVYDAGGFLSRVGAKLDIQITPRASQDASRSIFNPARYIDGFSLGLGSGISLPVSISGAMTEPKRWP